MFSKTAVTFSGCVATTASPSANCEKKCKFPVPAKCLTEADVNRAIDWLQDGNYVAWKEGNNPMSYNNTKTEAQTQREYLNQRLNYIASEKNTQLHEKFNTSRPENPTSYKELIDAIKNDKFEVDKKIAGRVDDYVEEEGRYYGSPFEGIKWKLENAPDWDGYRAAATAVGEQKTKAKDVIMSGVYTDGLKAIQDFEAWQPAGPAN